MSAETVFVCSAGDVEGGAVKCVVASLDAGVAWLAALRPVIVAENDNMRRCEARFAFEAGITDYSPSFEDELGPIKYRDGGAVMVMGLGFWEVMPWPVLAVPPSPTENAGPASQPDEAEGDTRWAGHDEPRASFDAADAGPEEKRDA